MGFTRTNLLVIAVAAGLGLAGLIHSCDQRLARISERTSTNHDSKPTASEAPGTHDKSSSPKRIAVYSAPVVEILYALGVGDRIAAVTRFATHPKAATFLPDLGGVMDVNFERLSSLAPDLIIAQSASEKLRDFAATRRIPFLRLDIETIEDVYRTATTLGAMFGRETSAKGLVRDIQADLEKVARAVRSRNPVRCFISVDRSPGNLSALLSVGKDGFLPQILAIAGGRNIFDDLETRYPVISKEALVARAPEVILELKPGLSNDERRQASLIGDWQLLRALPATKNNRVRVIGHDGGLLPGPRMAETAMEIAAVLHPDAFEDGARE